MPHGLDTDQQVFFYEQEFYPLSNFSAFAVEWRGRVWPTSEHAYHSEKFVDQADKEIIYECRSAHDAFKNAQMMIVTTPNWKEIREVIMYGILTAKLSQHPYVRKKLMETGERELIENSWRDDFWGWGENREGQNALGKLWMRIRTEMQR